MKQKIKTTKTDLYTLGKKLGLYKNDVDNILASRPTYGGLLFSSTVSPINMYKGDSGGGWYSTISINDFH